METAKSVIPLRGYVVLKPIAPQTVTDAGVELPDSAQDKKTNIGIVTAVGDPVVEKEEKKFSPVEVKDTVVYKKYTSQEVKINTEEYHLVSFDDLIAKLV